MKKIVDKIRKKVCPRRLYQYGTLGLIHFDDRSRLEKIFDYIDKLAERIDKRFEKRKFVTKHVFRSFFDVSTGQVISSVSQIDQICKDKGLEFTTFREIDNEAKRFRKSNKQEISDISQQGARDILRNIKKGKRSYKREIMERIRKGEYHIGQKPTAN